MKFLALTLSTAFSTMSSESQNVSLYTLSVSLETIYLCAVKFKSELILVASRHATSLLNLVTSVFLNRNCLFRLLTSILSLSVHYTLPPLDPKPVSAKNFKNSHPRAPAPTKNKLVLCIFSTNDLP